MKATNAETLNPASRQCCSIACSVVLFTGAVQTASAELIFKIPETRSSLQRRVQSHYWHPPRVASTHRQ